MKNKVQLVMIAMLSLILLVPAIASERPVQEDSASYNELGMYTPITEKEITLRVLMPLNSGYVTDIKTNSFTKMMEETTGVKLSFEEVAAGDSFNDVRNLMISSGDYPDIIINSGYTNSDIVRYGAEGIFLPLNYYIENTMPAYTKYLNKYTTYENAIAQMTCTDGNIYSPYVGYSQAYHNHVANYKCFIYKPWLEALGMSNPTTIDEFYDLLVAFKTKDPNGNGKADEIPLIANFRNLRTFLVNAFCYDSGTATHLWVTDDGVVESSYTSDAYREAVTFIRKLYAEGLLDTTTFTVNDAGVKELTMASSGNVVGVSMSNAMTGISTADSEVFEGFTNVLTPLKGPEGVQYCRWNHELYDANAFLITSACKYPELALRWYDYFFEDVRVPLACAEGVEDVNWVMCKEGEIGINGEPAVWKRLTSFATTGAVNHAWGSTSFNNIYDHSSQASAPGAQAYELYQATTRYEPYAVPYKNYMPTMLWLTTDESVIATQYETDLGNFMDEAFTYFVMGTYDVTNDNDWAWYLNELKAIGLEDYLAIQQAAYDAMIK